MTDDRNTSMERNVLKERADELAAEYAEKPSISTELEPIVVDPDLLAILKAGAPVLPPAAEAYDLMVENSIGFSAPGDGDEDDAEDIEWGPITLEESREHLAAHMHHGSHDWGDTDGPTLDDLDVDTCQYGPCDRTPDMVVWYRDPKEKVPYCTTHGEKRMGDRKAYNSSQL